MADIILATVNAKFIHASVGLRYLLANLGELKPRAEILEFDLQQRAADVAECILARAPRIVGLGVYIWNAAISQEVAALLKRLDPSLILILGGPEVSYETDRQSIVDHADYVITGEADLEFARLAHSLLLGGDDFKRDCFSKIIAAPLPDPARLKLPYTEYNDIDVTHRIIYVEASRGCPFTCEFCLSSLEIPVRAFPLPPLLDALKTLLDRGVRQFKFVDRTFNLNLNVSRAILQFFLDQWQPGLFLHFEMIPDRLPDGLRDVIARFPPGALQFEVGIQSFNPEVCNRIRRRQDFDRLEANFQFLREHSGVHIHADLIAGLPGESLDSFAAGFDRLVRIAPQEIQVGILKRLRGTPIVRHDADFHMVYNPFPPYEILKNSELTFADLQRIRRFAQAWDRVANSGHFIETTPLIWAEAPSPFRAFATWSEWLHRRNGRTHGIALTRLSELLFDYLIQERTLPSEQVSGALLRDYQRTGRTDIPVFLRPHVSVTPNQPRASSEVNAPKRQTRHLAAS